MPCGKNPYENCSALIEAKLNPVKDSRFFEDANPPYVNLGHPEAGRRSKLAHRFMTHQYKDKSAMASTAREA